MNERDRGFTLVELLAVIILLSLLMLLVFPKIVSSIKNSSKDTDKLNEELIYSATKLYVEKYKNNYPKKDGNVYCIAVKDLVNEEYLTEPVVFSDGKDISDIKTVEVSYIGGFEYILKDNSECVPIVQYVDSVGVEIQVPEGMTPVIYENGNWKVGSTLSKWYDYANQEWANTIILKSGVTKNVGDTIDVSSEAQAMFVYIPKYEYKIEGQYGTHIDGTLGTSYLPGEIKVNFISKNINKASKGYHIHPAFTFGDLELDGIWVGKFKITGSAETPTILPNLEILTNKSRAEYFEISKKYNNYINNIDSHVIKNVEWAAIFYLSQSRYGKYGNSIYTDINKEMYIRALGDNYISGKSTGEIDSRDKTNICSYDNLSDRGSGTGSCGGGASSTGNITGVYDVNGTPYEYVMGVGNNTITNSGFSELPDAKYYDNYIGEKMETACDGGICYGHALSETNKLYNEENYQIGFNKSGTNYWILRGSFIRIEGIGTTNSNLTNFQKVILSARSEKSQDASSRIVIVSTT